ncbi:MAG: DUF2520 domain-containing protein [Bacteroidetes bacterium]|nr:DUF2520 domain-containing protein [Bacteroidota bacterium]
MSRMTPVTIVGAGAVGRSLALALYRSGVTVAGVYSANGTSARALARRVAAPSSGTLTGKIPFASVVILAVPDDAIPAAAVQVLRSAGAERIRTIIHCSGALASLVLRPAAKRKISCASMHPLMTFPKKGRTVPMKDTWFALEGDRTAVALCRSLVKRMEGSSFTIDARKKTFYHMAAVFASNYTVTLLEVAGQLAREAGVPAKDLWRIFGPLVTASVNNALRHSPAAALTGPIARGDRATVLRHLDALRGSKRMEHLLPVYAALGIEAAALAGMER